MAPQPSNRTAMAMTTNLLFSAKSTSERIISRFLSFVQPAASLSEYMVQDQGIGHYLLARLEPGPHLLNIGWQNIAAHYFYAAELVARRRHENIIAIVHVHDRRSWDFGVRFFHLPLKRGLYKPAQAHQTGVWHLDAD